MKSACMCDILIIHSCKCVLQGIQKQKDWYTIPIDDFFGHTFPNGRDREFEFQIRRPSSCVIALQYH